jgi:hypothetical protein
VGPRCDGTKGPGGGSSGAADRTLARTTSTKGRVAAETARSDTGAGRSGRTTGTLRLSKAAPFISSAKPLLRLTKKSMM